MEKKHWIHVFITFWHNEQEIKNKHIASFINTDDAYKFCKDTNEYYRKMGDGCYIEAIQDSKCLFKFGW